MVDELLRRHAISCEMYVRHHSATTRWQRLHHPVAQRMPRQALWIVTCRQHLTVLAHRTHGDAHCACNLAYRRPGIARGCVTSWWISAPSWNSVSRWPRRRPVLEKAWEDEFDIMECNFARKVKNLQKSVVFTLGRNQLVIELQRPIAPFFITEKINL